MSWMGRGVGANAAFGPPAVREIEPSLIASGKCPSSGDPGLDRGEWVEGPRMNTARTQPDAPPCRRMGAPPTIPRAV